MSEQEPKIESFNNIPIGITRQDSLPDSDKNKENNDQISYDKNYWNLGEIPFPDLSLKKESESKLSIDVPDMSNQRLKEYLNEDLLDAIDVSPMTTPKNIMNFDNNEINLDNKDLFQFSLYNNNNDEKDEKENIPEEILLAKRTGGFNITVEDGVYIVDAPWLIRILNSVDLDDYESLQYFQRVLKSSGIIDALVAKGINEGDTVSIYDVEFDFVL